MDEIQHTFKQQLISDKILVSIIIPIYNMERYIGNCLRSILQQKFKNYEVIIINDGSTDKSEEIAKSYANLDSNIKIHNQNNLGSGAARNYGLKMASGEYIYFLDPDDLMYDKNTLLNLVNNIRINNADMCGGNFVTLETNNKYSQFRTFKINEFHNHTYIPDQDGFFWRFLFKKD